MSSQTLYHKAKAPADVESTRLVTSRNEVVAKVIFLHLSVILFTGGACLRQPPFRKQTPPGSRQPPQEQTPPPPRSDTPPSRPPPGSRLQHTVNEWPVRILLECIPVFQCNQIFHKHTKLASLPTLYSYICSFIPYLHQMMINSKCKI